MGYYTVTHVITLPRTPGLPWTEKMCKWWEFSELSEATDRAETIWNHLDSYDKDNVFIESTTIEYDEDEVTRVIWEDGEWKI